MANHHVNPPQFSLRTVFIVVLLLAGLLAIVAPQVRQSQSVEREGFLAVWAGAILSSVVVVVISTAMRLRSTAVAGGYLARLRHPWTIQAALFLLGALLVYLLVRTSLAAAATASRPEDRAFSFMIGVIVGFVATVPWLMALFNDAYPQLREAGFYETYGFHRWSDVLEYHFRERPQLSLEVQLCDGKLSLPVQPQHRKTIEAVFAERASVQQQ